MRYRYLLGAACFLFAVFYFHRVPKTIVPADRPYLRRYLELASISPDSSHALSNLTYAEELELIRDVQQALLTHNPPGAPIPQGRPRRPADLYNFSGGGHCFDRAFTLAMLYRQMGLATRHAALYRDVPARSQLSELLSRGTPSHAALEVKTRKGWLIVDSNEAFIGLNQDSLPRAYADLTPADSSRWLTPLPSEVAWTVSGRATVIYGLYARHGRAFPPYNFVPDLNWRELMYNF